MPPLPNIAIVGATGAVGREFLAVLEQRNFKHNQIRLFASARSAGQTLIYRGKPHPVEELGDRSFDGIDIALFSAGSDISKKFGPKAAAAGAIVIDNSSAFRMTEGVPLVVPEVNPEALDAIRQGTSALRADSSSSSSRDTSDHPRRGAIIANPNCSTIIMIVPVTPLRKAFGIDRVVVSTYQAVSGAGAKGMDELSVQTREVLESVDAGQADLASLHRLTVSPSHRLIFQEPCAFNVFSHNSAVDLLTGRNVEEEKMVAETRKIWSDPHAKIAATCIRVPVMRAHAESITVTLSRPATEAQVREALANAPGIAIIDDRAKNSFPTPLKASGQDPVYVGRIRPDDTQPFFPGTSMGTSMGTSALRADSSPGTSTLRADSSPGTSGGALRADSSPGTSGGALRAASPPGTSALRADSSSPRSSTYTGFHLFVCSDQLRKGAALNAVQIAELL
jgi:aspartate-semialdehyde dehydrogenase